MIPVVLKEYLRGAQLFAAFCVGRIPVHQLRLLFYRGVLRVRIGPGTTFHWRTVFFAPERIHIGRNCVIGNDAFLDGRGGLYVADNVNIGGHVQVYTMDHDPQSPDFAARSGPVSIGPRAYVATRATVLAGVTIGEGAVVAAGAVVTRDVGPYTIVGGVPARKIGERPAHLSYTLKYHLPFQ